MRSSKGSRRISVRDVAYRWRAKGDDGYISVGIWPANNTGAYIYGTIRYHETWIEVGEGIRRSAQDQVVVTNRLVRRIIEFAIDERRYDPGSTADQLNLGHLDFLIDLGQALRADKAKRKTTPTGAVLPE